MKFFFPDSQDFVDPTFDFVTERRSGARMRSRDDRYAHEVFNEPPFDGLLVSKAIVEGSAGSGKSSKYNIAQRHRLLRVGVRDFFRLDDQPGSRRLRTMGDCGAFSYVREEKPPFSVDDVIDFYEKCDFDLGVSVDHVILAFDASLDETIPGLVDVPIQYVRRQELTLDLAADFLRRQKARNSRFVPVGVAQGWSPKSYASAIKQLQKIGYSRIALGGLVPLRTPDLLATVEAAGRVRRSKTQFHLLGVTRTDHVEALDRHGVTSFDTTSPFLRSFKDATHNYYAPGQTYTAIRIPQVQGNRTVENLIRSGRVDQGRARILEQKCLELLRAYDAGNADIDEVLSAVLRYDALFSTEEARRDRAAAYRRTLQETPWKDCGCEVCTGIGIEVMIFRGSERNKRRGFHNLFVLYQQLTYELRHLGRPSLVAVDSAKPLKSDRLKKRAK